MPRLLVFCFCISATLSTSAQFITTWTVIGKDLGITIPHNLINTLNYNYTVDWGDGTAIETFVTRSGASSHTYAAAGTYTVTISGTYNGNRYEIYVRSRLYIQSPAR